MKNQNEAVSSKVNYDTQLLINNNLNHQTKLETKNDLNPDSNKDLSKPKLNFNASSYIPKNVRKPSESVSVDKPLDIKTTITHQISVNPSISASNVKPNNPIYIPHQGGASISTNSKLFVI